MVTHKQEKKLYIYTHKRHEIKTERENGTVMTEGNKCNSN